MLLPVPAVSAAAGVPIAIMLVMVIVLATATWVYKDAEASAGRGRRITSAVGTVQLSTPTAWFFACLLLWEFCFPLYIDSRRP